MTALTLQIPPSLKFTDEEFEQIVAFNKELRLELTTQGELIIMSPTGGETGNRNFDLIGQIWFWNRKNNLGKAFDSSTGFKLPNGATRSPDASWIKMERWDEFNSTTKKEIFTFVSRFCGGISI